MTIKTIGTTLIIEENGKIRSKKCSNKDHLQIQINNRSCVFKSKKVYDRKRKDYGRY